MRFITSDGAYVTPDRLTDRELRLHYVHVYHDLRQALMDLRYGVVGEYGRPMSAPAMCNWDRLNVLADELRRRKRR